MNHYHNSMEQNKFFQIEPVVISIAFVLFSLSIPL